jgi:hypothetical protein
MSETKSVPESESVPESVPELSLATNLKTELKKLNQEERYKLFNLLSQEENNEKKEKEENEAKEILKNQCPLTTKLNQVVDELRVMKKQISDLKYECVNNCINNAVQCSLGSNNCCEMESMESALGECSFFSFSWCPFLIFLAFVLISVLMKPMKCNPLLL